MARSKAELVEYVKGLAKEKGLSDEQATRALAVLSGEADTVTKEELTSLVVPLMDLPLGRHADYSRAMDALTKEKTKLKTWYDDEALPAAQKNRKYAEDMAALARKYEAKFGPLDEIEVDDDGRGTNADGKTISKKDMDAMRTAIKAEASAEMASQFVSALGDQSRIMARHHKLFKGELLDINPLLEAIGKHAADGKQITFDQAYDEVHGEKIRQIETDSRAAEIKAAETRGAEAERKRLQLARTQSSGASATGEGVFWDRQKPAAGDDKLSAEEADAAREAAFVNDLNSELARTTSSSTTT